MSRLKQLDRIPVGIFQLDLLPARAYLHLISTMQAGVATPLCKLMTSLETYQSRFDEGGWRLFKRTIEESRKQGERHILAEHFIRQLFAEDEDLFNVILEDLRVESDTFRRIIDERLRNRRQHFEGGTRLDVEVIDMLKRALRRARAHGRDKISKEDMLVALAQGEAGALLEIFRGMGIDPFAVANVILAAVERDRAQSSPVLQDDAQPFCRAGDTIRITTGAFTAMSAKVKEVDYERSVLRVKVNIFGRSELIELSFSDVEKISFD
jgi:ATP-dependent Clp protease ATP-binding subunit ClpA